MAVRVRNLSNNPSRNSPKIRLTRYWHPWSTKVQQSGVYMRPNDERNFAFMRRQRHLSFAHRSNLELGVQRGVHNLAGAGGPPARGEGKCVLWPAVLEDRRR